MGWTALALIGPLSRLINKGNLFLLFAGAAVYSVGGSFNLLERVPFHDAIWNGFALTEAGLRFGAIVVGFVL